MALEASRSWHSAAIILALGIAACTLLGGSPSSAGLSLAGSAPTAVGPPGEATAPLRPLNLDATTSLDPASVSAMLAPLLADPALGANPSLAVVDGLNGSVVMGSAADVPLIPASSLKVATGSAVLAALGPAHPLLTRVVRNPDGQVVLIGGGDPTLRTEPAAAEAAYPVPTSLAQLAEATVAALRAAGVAQLSLGYDSTLFTGPALNPDWDPSFVGQGIVSPVSALTVDPASPGISAAALESDPAGTVANWFAQRLQQLGIAVTAVAPITADPAATPVASVASPPIVGLVDRMLDISDNDVAEALFRLAAIGRGLPGSTEGGAQAVTATLTELGVPMTGLVIRDGSGLSRSNRITALALADLLRVQTADPGDPAADESTWLPPGLPVGGLTGSLAGRFEDPATSVGAGLVHAKTGTLTGITSLTGVVATTQGRPVVFSAISNETPDTPAARQALDRIAAALAACGCQPAAP